MNNLFSELSYLLFQLNTEPINKSVKNRLINTILWCATECTNESGLNWQKNKHYGQRYWSQKALQTFINNPEGSHKINSLIHEHAVPKKILKELIEECKTVNQVEKILKSFALAVIVTREEDKIISIKFKSKMPDNKKPTSKTLFSRYLKSNIIIYDIKQRGVKIHETLKGLTQFKDIKKFKKILD